MAGSRIELSLTESFAKHKRNVLLVSSIVFVLALASPREVKIPGLGTNEAVPGAVAFFLLGCALAYFLLSYWVELLAVRARNLKGTAANDLGDVSEKLLNAISPITMSSDKVTGIISQLLNTTNDISNQYKISDPNHALSNFSGHLDAAKTFVDRIVNPNSKSGQVQSERVSLTLQEINEKMDKSFSSIKSLEQKLDYISQTLSSFEAGYKEEFQIIDKSSRELAGSLNKISSRISRSQRVGFGVLEQGVPIFLSLLALALCVDGAFFGSGGASIIRGYVPAIAESQPVAVPKVGTQSTETRQNP